MGCPDADHDGVCDSVDVCPGFPDDVDSDQDGRPDGCEPALLRDINSVTNDSQIDETVVFAGSIYLIMGNGADALPELWKTDFSGNGLTNVSHLADPATEQVTRVAVAGQHLFYTVRRGNSSTLWVISGSADPIRIGPTFSTPGWNIAQAAEGGLYMGFTDGTTFADLWYTDGTETGTVQLLSSTTPDATFITGFVASGSALYFTLSTAAGWALWYSDGTTGGTRSLATTAWSIGSQVLFGGKLYFIRIDSPAAVPSVWMSDGTVAGTHQAAFSGPGPDLEPLNLYTSGSRLMALYVDAAHAATLWELAGDGVSMMPVGVPTPNGATVYSAASGMYVVTSSSVYRSDGSNPPQQVFTGRTREWVAADNGLYFVAQHCECSDLDRELYYLDARGPVLLASGLGPGPPWGNTLRSTATSGERLVFAMWTARVGNEPWVSDGTASGTRLLLDFNTSTAGSNPWFVGSAGDLVAFNATDGTGNPELWIAGDDGSVSALEERVPELKNLPMVRWASVGDYLFFRPHENYVPDHITPLYRLDPAGDVVRVADDSSSLGSMAFATGNKVVVIGTQGLSVTPLADLGGSTPSFAALTALGAGPTGTAAASIVPLRDWNGYEWLLDADAHVWKTDGTGAGTLDVAAAIASEPPIDLGDALYLVGNDGNFWRTRGAQGDLVQVTDLTAAGLVPEVHRFAASFDGFIYFSATELGGTAPKWFRTDDAGNVAQFANVAPSLPPVIVGARLVALDGDGNVWSTDGANDPVLLDRRPRMFPELAVYRGAAYFTGYDDEHGYELWHTDGTPSGTVLEADIEPGAPSSNAGTFYTSPGFYPTNGALYFLAVTRKFGFEPWVLRN